MEKHVESLGKDSQLCLAVVTFIEDNILIPVSGAAGIRTHKVGAVAAVIPIVRRSSHALYAEIVSAALHDVPIECVVLW